MLNGTSGFVVGSFELAGWLEAFVGPVVKQRVAHWPADALVKVKRMNMSAAFTPLSVRR